MLGHNEYPVSISHTYELILKQNKSQKKNNNNINDDNGNNHRNGADFAQQRGNSGDAAISGRGKNQPVAGTDDKLDPNQFCYNCQTPGHMCYTYLEEDRREILQS